MMKMRRGTKFGWLLVALSIVLCTWTIAGGFTSTAEEEGNVIVDEAASEDTSREVVEYTPATDETTEVDADENIEAEEVVEEETDLVSEIMTFADGLVGVTPHALALDASNSSSINAGDYEKDEITSITCPTQLSNDVLINAGAFSEFTDMTSVTINTTGDVIIGASAFSGCSSLESVSITGSSISISSAAFANCKLGSLSLNGTVSLGDRCFASNSSIPVVDINGAVTLGSKVFDGSDVGTFKATGILGATSLSFYNSDVDTILAGDTATYTIYKGCLYSGTTLLYATPQDTVYIKGGTTAIDPDALAFSDADTIEFESPIAVTSISNQGSWPPNLEGIVINAIGATGTVKQAIEDFVNEVNKDRPEAKKISANYVEGGGGGNETPTNKTYTVTVNEMFLDVDGNVIVESGKDNPRVNAALSQTYKANSTITAASYSGYTLLSANSPFTVTANGEVDFIYKANAAGAVLPGSQVAPTPSSGDKRYTITVNDTFYKSDGKTKYSTKTRCYDRYTVGASYSYEPKAYVNYTLMEATNQSGTVSSDRTVTFKYKAISDSDLEPRTSGSAPSTDTVAGAVYGKPIVYTITSGANQSVASTAGIVSMTCDGAYSKFLYVMMDGTVVDKSNYAVAEGSTILAFTADYISKLGGGKHHIRMVYTDGYADTTLTITGKATTTVTYTVSSNGTVSKGHAKDSTPQTADGFDERYLLCMAILLCGIGFIVYSKQRKFEILTSGRDD